jgi:hypothetical protein
MEIAQAIKDLPREELEQLYVQTIHNEHVQIHRANALEQVIQDIYNYLVKYEESTWWYQSMDILEGLYGIIERGMGNEDN